MCAVECKLEDLLSYDGGLEVRMLLKAILRDKSNNIAVVAKAGCGRSTFVKALAHEAEAQGRNTRFSECGVDLAVVEGADAIDALAIGEIVYDNDFKDIVNLTEGTQIIAGYHESRSTAFEFANSISDILMRVLDCSELEAIQHVGKLANYIVRIGRRADGMRAVLQVSSVKVNADGSLERRDLVYYDGYQDKIIVDWVNVRACMDLEESETAV